MPESEPASDESLSALLNRYARAATLEAFAVMPTAHLSHEARAWTRSAHEALMAAALISEQPIDDEERAELAAMVAEQRRQITVCGEALAEAIRQRDWLARFLRTLAGEFESAQTPTAARIADRIRRVLRDLDLGEDEEDDADG